MVVRLQLVVESVSQLLTRGGQPIPYGVLSITVQASCDEYRE
jgi:hypothetical protein